MAFHRTDLFFVAERRLSLGRRFNARRRVGETPSRGATVEGGEEKSTVAPRLNYDSPPTTGVKTPA